MLKITLPQIWLLLLEAEKIKSILILKNHQTLASVLKKTLGYQGNNVK